MNLSASYYYPTSPLHKVHNKYHRWDGKCNTCKEVTGVFPKESLLELVWSPVEDSCIALMHLETLKHSLEGPYPSLELSRKKYKCLFCCLCHKSCR